MNLYHYVVDEETRSRACLQYKGNLFPIAISCLKKGLAAFIIFQILIIQKA